MTPITEQEVDRINVPAEAAAIIMHRAQERDLAQMRLDDVGNMARIMLDVPQGWELRIENGAMFFDAPKE